MASHPKTAADLFVKTLKEQNIEIPFNAEEIHHMAMLKPEDSEAFTAWMAKRNGDFEAEDVKQWLKEHPVHQYDPPVWRDFRGDPLPKFMDETRSGHNSSNLMVVGRDALGNVVKVAPQNPLPEFIKNSPDVTFKAQFMNMKDIVLDPAARTYLNSTIALTGGCLFLAWVIKRRFKSVMPFLNTRLYDKMKSVVPHLPFQGKFPNVGEGSFVAFNSTLIGDVVVGKQSSIFYKTILRGDVNKIEIGSNVHIKDGCMVHVAKNGLKGVPIPTIVGDSVVVGSNSLLHACHIEGNNIIGPCSQILDGAKIEKNSMIEAGALVGPGKVVPSGQLWGGVPAKYIRDLTSSEIDSIALIVSEAGELAENHAVENKKGIEQILVEQEEKEFRDNFNPDYVPYTSFRTILHEKPNTSNKTIY